MVLYTLFHWSGPPVRTQLVFCMRLCVWRYIPHVPVERDVLHVRFLLPPPFSWWTRGPAYPWISWAAPWPAAHKMHTSQIMLCANVVCLVRCPWRLLCLSLLTFLVTLQLLLRPMPWGSSEPRLLFFKGCHCGRPTYSFFNVPLGAVKFCSNSEFCKSQSW